jgi:hypothetical protein
MLISPAHEFSNTCKGWKKYQFYSIEAVRHTGYIYTFLQNLFTEESNFSVEIPKIFPKILAKYLSIKYI